MGGSREIQTIVQDREAIREHRLVNRGLEEWREKGHHAKLSGEVLGPGKWDPLGKDGISISCLTLQIMIHDTYQTPFKCMAPVLMT